MFFRVVFLLGQFVKEICGQLVWKFDKEMYGSSSMMVIGESTGLEHEFRNIS